MASVNIFRIIRTPGSLESGSHGPNLLSLQSLRAHPVITSGLPLHVFHLACPTQPRFCSNPDRVLVPQIPS